MFDGCHYMFCGCHRKYSTDIFYDGCNRLSKDDFNKPCQDLAIFLLGKILVRKLSNGIILRGQIVETECYLGKEDKASHSYNGKMTKRTEPMYMPAGTLYVYTIYYGYHCLNISSSEPGAVVLIRALQPLTGLDTMKYFRSSKSKSMNKSIAFLSLSNGPSKLCIALNITKKHLNKVDLSDPLNDQLWVEDNPDFNKNERIINTSRIGIGPSATDWVTKPLRYYIFKNDCVSKRDKKAENFQQNLQI